MYTVRSTTPMHVAKIGYLVISALMCALGIWMIVNPDFSVSMLGILCGTLLIVFGAIKLIGYFSKDLYRLAFQYDLVFGALMMVIGILMLVNPGNVMQFICITLGIFILTDSILKARIALDAKTFGITSWLFILITAVLSGLFGLLLMFRPGEGSEVLAILLGVTLLVDGILNFITVIATVKIIKNQRPDVIEVEYVERDE